MNEKAALRSDLEILRAQVPPEIRSTAAQSLTERLLASSELKLRGNVAAFASFGSEIPTDLLLNELRRRGCRVLLPRVQSRNRMVFHDFSDLESLHTDRFGIRTPDGNAFEGVLDLILVPGLAFGLDGSRLGMGGGFYDRFLAAYTKRDLPIVGLGFDVQVVQTLPDDVHDVRVTNIATPSRIISCEALPGPTVPHTVPQSD